MDIRMFFGGGKKSDTPQPPPKTDNKKQESKIPHKSSSSTEHRSSKSIDSQNNDINASQMKRKSDQSESKIPHSKHHDKSENSEPPRKRLHKGSSNEPVIDITSESKENKSHHHHHKHDEESAVKRKSDGVVDNKENKFAKSNESKPISKPSLPSQKTTPSKPVKPIQQQQQQQPPPPQTTTTTTSSSIPPPSKLKRKNNPLALKSSKPSSSTSSTTTTATTAKSSSTTTPEPPVTTKKSPKVTKVKPDNDNNNNNNNKNDDQKTSPPKPKSNRAFYFMTKGMIQPPHHGELDMPVGKPNCLVNKTFVITGVCDHFTREELTELVQEYGGKVTSAVSGKTSYLLIGNILEDGRPVTEGSKYKKAKEQTHTPILNEEQFCDLINKTNPNPKPKQTDDSSTADSIPTNNNNNKTSSSSSSSKSLDNKNSDKLKSESQSGSMRSVMSISIPINNNNNNNNNNSIRNAILKKGEDKELWTDKYKPTKITDIIGNSNNIKLLKEWLENWESLHLHLSSDNQSKPSSSSSSTTTTPSKNGNDSGSKSKKNTPSKRKSDLKKAVLISGPPGIGKSTTATIIGKELGYEIFELNASDSRNKSALEDELKEAISGNCVISFKVKNNHNRLVIMDEVDGMSSGDRGGMSELIKLIEKSKCPIICICNDRQNTNIRSLSSHCKDLQFLKPPLMSIRNKMLNICKNEGLSIESNAIDTIIESCNYDIRQILNNLQMLRKNDLYMNKSNVSNHIKNTSKDVNRASNAFEACKVILYTDTTTNKVPPFYERLESFYVDYDMVPLLVHENYITSINNCRTLPEDEKLRRLNECSEILSSETIMSSHLRQNQSWSLLSYIGYMNVSIGSICKGSLGMPAFPRWLGNNSSANKRKKDINHLLLRSKNVINTSSKCYRLDYLPFLRNHLISPLYNENCDINEVINNLDEYGYDNVDLLEIMCEFVFNGEDLRSDIDKKVKTNLTKTFNKRSHMKSQSLIHDQQESMSFKSLKKSNPKKKLKRNSKVVMEDENDDDEEESQSINNNDTYEDDIIDLD